MPAARILVVEDDQFIRELYAETLQSEGYMVETCVDGEEGAKKIKEGNWDLVLLDIIMPKIDGLSIAKSFDQEGSWKRYAKSLVFLTNLDKEEEIKEALRLGDGYVIKSQITPGDLIREVQLYLSKIAPSSPVVSS